MLTIAEYNKQVKELHEKFKDSGDSFKATLALYKMFEESNKSYKVGFLGFCNNRFQTNPLHVIDCDGIERDYTRLFVLTVNKKVIDVTNGFPALSLDKYLARLVCCQYYTGGVRLLDGSEYCDFAIDLVMDAIKKDPTLNDMIYTARGLCSLPSTVVSNQAAIDQLLEYLKTFPKNTSRAWTPLYFQLDPDYVLKVRELQETINE